MAMLTTEGQTSATVATAVEFALNRRDVPIENSDVKTATPKVAGEVVRALAEMPSIAVVDVNSPWTSKINITQAITAFLALLTAFGLPISDDQKVSVLTVVGVFGPVLTAVFKTFFTRSITTTSK